FFELAHRGHFLAAGRAPGRPEVEQHDLAAVVRKPVLAAGKIGQLELRCRPAAPWAKLARGVSRSPECERVQHGSESDETGRHRAHSCHEQTKRQMQMKFFCDLCS